MKYLIVGLIGFATLALACPYDLSSTEPSALTGLFALITGAS